MTIRIVTDSASDISLEEAEDLGIEIVPLSVRFGEAEYTDLVDLSVSDFYQKMAESDLLPSTAAPSPGAFEAAFKRCAEAGAEGVICINLSLALSATGQAAQLAADALANTLPVKCIDSKSITSGLGTIIRKAAAAAKDGGSMDEIVALVDNLASRTRIFATLDTLENLKKGGRIGGAKAMLGTMLQFKPCLDLSSGEVVEAGRQRTRKKSLIWLKEVLESEGEISELTIIHGDAPDVEEFATLISDIIPIDQIRINQLGAVIGTHGGPRVLGVTYLVR
ncbi:MAG: DegV family protein [Actinomycetota bacterium]|nr:DegV family protein [Actinomycetota bacterium]MEC8118410.1 DegV family protein [Actinomycetota bacterium]MEC8334704.1 DegV family protein [Actinomycetota bacterium]MEC8365115.1 DegV family protein [Actinomycetota bacterium]MEC9210775.1 DegV family protein [Actinomycetota bacterium]|tara:strand:+ start:722 stop:1558 length:837 start_codon:yes stop_codon:yes gene_type:complete